MNNEGPLLESLTRRLAECPPDFLEPPQTTAGGVVSVAAVVSDLLTVMGREPLSAPEAAPFLGRQDSQGKRSDIVRNRLSITLILCWLYSDDWFIQRGGQVARGIYELLANRLETLAEIVPAQQFVTDPDHREELARLALQALGLRPAGESPEQAADRLNTLDSVERRRVLQMARKSEERSRAVLEAMASKAAQDAAAKWNRE